MKASAMQTAKGKVVEGGRIILPAGFRRSLGLEKGDTVLIELHDDELRVRPRARCTCAACRPSCTPSDRRTYGCRTSWWRSRRAEAAREAEDHPGPRAGADAGSEVEVEATTGEEAGRG